MYPYPHLYSDGGCLLECMCYGLKLLYPFIHRKQYAFWPQLQNAGIYHEEMYINGLKNEANNFLRETTNIISEKIARNWLDSLDLPLKLSFQSIMSPRNATQNEVLADFFPQRQKICILLLHSEKFLGRRNAVMLIQKNTDPNIVSQNMGIYHAIIPINHDPTNNNMVFIHDPSFPQEETKESYIPRIFEAWKMYNYRYAELSLLTRRYNGFTHQIADQRLPTSLMRFIEPNEDRNHDDV